MIRPVRSFGYVVGRGLRGMGQAPLVQLLAVATMAVCMLLLGTIVLAWTNARGVAGSWGVDVPMTAYLVDDPDPAEVDAMIERLQEVPEVVGIEAVTPEQAMTRLRDGLGGDPELLTGIEPGVLPGSVEIRLDPEAAPELQGVLAEQLAALPVVDEVAVTGDWAQRARAMLDTLGELALGAAGLVALACMAIVWSTIRLGVYARRTEIQILRLVGATAAFVRGSFVVEGIVQGALGSAMALAMLWVGFDAVRPFLEDGLSMLFAAGALRFFTPLEAGLGVAFGGLVGLAGARAAVSRYEET